MRARRAAMARRRSTVVVAAALAWVLLLGGYSDDGGGDVDADEATSTTAPADPDAVTPREVVGEATVEIGDRSWDFELTSCATADGRFTAQGDDTEGVTFVATFLVESAAGSVTVTEGDESWSVGPAGGTEATDVEVSETGVTGGGDFARRTLTAEDPAPAVPEGEEPPADAPDEEEAAPEAGTFTVACEA